MTISKLRINGTDYELGGGGFNKYLEISSYTDEGMVYTIEQRPPQLNDYEYNLCVAGGTGEYAITSIEYPDPSQPVFAVNLMDYDGSILSSVNAPRVCGFGTGAGASYGLYLYNNNYYIEAESL